MYLERNNVLMDKIRAELENQLLARIGILPNQQVPNVEAQIAPQVQSQRLNEITNNVSNSSDKSDFKQSLTSLLEDKEILLLKLLSEFTKKDEGKVLAAELGKFSRFVQSEVAKSNTKEISSTETQS